MKRLLLFLLISIPAISFSQDLKFGFANNSNQFLNPANLGIRKLRSYTLIHRSQWPSLSGSINSTLFTFENSVGFPRFGNLGGYIATDRFHNGALIFNDLGLSFAYPIGLTRKLRMTIGYSAILKHTYIDIQKFSHGDLINPRRDIAYIGQPTQKNTFGMDNNFGVMLYSKRLYFGFSAKHLLTINYVDNPSYNIQAGYRFVLPRKDDYKSKLAIKGGISYTYQKDNHRISVNSSVQYKQFILGGSVGTPNDFEILAGVQFYKGFNISYIYGQVTGTITNANAPSHEIMLRFDPHIRCCKCFFNRFEYSDF